MLRLRPHNLNAARAAVLVAVTKQFAHATTTPRIDTEGARVRAAYPMPESDRAFAVRECGRLVADRSAVVTAVFPKVRFSSALSYESFYVARTSRGWALWDIPPSG